MEKNIIKICLSDIQIKDLNENVYPIGDLNKTMGNLIFTKASTIEVSDIARSLHKGEVADVTNEELNEIVIIINSNQYFLPWVHVQIIKYFVDKMPMNENEEGAN